ncbi:MAG: YbhB/YbcL family Raf kinase inhibitor-like protein [Microbacteriaceae bacterium]
MANDPNWNLPELPSFTLESPDVAPGAMLPTWARAAGAGGEDRSPALAWSGAPAETKSFVVTVYDPDAPTASGWWHWAVVNLPSSTTSLPQNAGDPGAGLLPAGAVTLPNELREARYGGAWPPPGHGAHRYFFTVTALDVPTLDLPAGATPGLAGFQVFGHAIARAQFHALSETNE